VAAPDRKVVALVGDGSAAYTLQALWSLAREGLDVTVVILANASYRILNIEMQRTGAQAPKPLRGCWRSAGRAWTGPPWRRASAFRPNAPATPSPSTPPLRGPWLSPAAPDRGGAGMTDPVLETERLIMRPHGLEDFPDSLAMWSDAEIARSIGGRSPSEEEVWRRLLSCAGSWALLGFGYWVVREREGGRFVGEVGFGDSRRGLGPAFDDAPQIGWTVAPAFGVAAWPARRSPPPWRGATGGPAGAAPCA
jgi:hypothetical protein